MKFIYLITLLIFFSCGPSEKEKQKLEEEIKSIKLEMAALLQDSKELTVSFVNYKTKLANIESAETRLEDVRSELEVAAKGSKEYLNLKSMEEGWIRRVETDKQKLLEMGSYDLMEKQIQSFSQEYDSLDEKLKEKTLMLEK